MPLITRPDVKLGEYIIRVQEIEHHNWSYAVYKKGKKWRKLRSIGFYLTPEAAERAGRHWLANHLNLSR